MINLHFEVFKKAIDMKRMLTLVFNSREKGVITRKCIPFDIGPSRRYKDGRDRYHFFNLDSPDGEHVLSIFPEQIVNIILLEESFDPIDYVTWKPTWFLSRDWGPVS